MALNKTLCYNHTMSAPLLNVTWQQGEDLVFQMVYKEGLTEVTTLPVDLTGFSVRMDVRNDVGLRLYTFNSHSLQDLDPITAGDQPDPTTEAVLNSAGEIKITVSRVLTLPPTGPFYQQLSAPTPKDKFDYDIFLRNTSDLQTKILRGQITLEKSVTLWL